MKAGKHLGGALSHVPVFTSRSFISSNLPEALGEQRKTLLIGGRLILLITCSMFSQWENFNH